MQQNEIAGLRVDKRNTYHFDPVADFHAREIVLQKLDHASFDREILSR